MTRLGVWVGVNGKAQGEEEEVIGDVTPRMNRSQRRRSLRTERMTVQM